MFGYLDACCRGTRADLTHCESHLIHHLKEIKLECFFSSFTSGNVLISCIKNFKCDFFIQQKLPCSRQWRLGLLRSRGFLVQIPLWNFYETSSEICSQPFVGSDLARWGGGAFYCVCTLNFAKKRENTLTSEASRTKVKHHPRVALSPLIYWQPFSLRSPSEVSM